jgi:hypothetical protein
LARCEGRAEEDFKLDHGMETYLQGRETGGDDDMVVFVGGIDPRAVEDRKRLKLSMKSKTPGWVMNSAREEKFQVVLG